MATYFMKTTTMLLTSVISVALTGCDEQAREFAQKTKTILDQRSEQISKKIAAEKDAYNKFAAYAAEDHRALVDSSLQNERNERGDHLAADYDEDRKPVSLWREDLADYAKADYSANRELLTAAMDANTQYLENFEQLSIEQDKVAALSKLLVALAMKPSIKEDVQALTSFAQDTKQEFDKKVCTQLKSQSNGKDPAATAAKTAYTSKNCDAILKP